MHFFRPCNSLIAILAALNCLSSLSQRAADYQADPSKKHLEQAGDFGSQDTPDTLAKLLSERMEHLNASADSSATSADKIQSLKKIIEIDRQIFNGLKNGGSSFVEGVEGVSKEDVMPIQQKICDASAASALALSKLIEEARDYADLVEVLSYYNAQVSIAHGEKHWRLAEAKALLRQAHWLAAADADQQSKWAAARKNLNDGTAVLRQRKWAEGAAKLDLAKSTFEELGVNDHFAYGETIANLAEAYFGMEDMQSAESVFRLAIDINDNLFDAPTPKMANMRISFSRVYRALNQVDKELALFEAAENIARHVHGTPSIELAQNLMLQGDLFFRSKQNELAVKSITQSAQMARETSQKTGHQNLSDSISIINNCHGLLSNYRQHTAAVEVAELGLSLVQQTQGETSVWTARWLVIVAQSQSAAGDFEPSLKNFSDAFSIYETIKGNPAAITPQDVEGYIQYANTLQQSGDLDRASQIIATAVELAKRLAGEGSMLYIGAVQNQSVIFHFAKKYVESEAAIASIMPWLEKNLGEGHESFRRVLRDQALNHENMQQWAAARQGWERLQRIQSAGDIQNLPNYLETLSHLAIACTKTGDKEAAEKWASELKSFIRKKP